MQSRTANAVTYVLRTVLCAQQTVFLFRYSRADGLSASSALQGHCVRAALTDSKLTTPLKFNFTNTDNN